MQPKRRFIAGNPGFLTLKTVAGRLSFALFTAFTQSFIKLKLAKVFHKG
jgi:hypothetical protein